MKNLIYIFYFFVGIIIIGMIFLIKQNSLNDSRITRLNEINDSLKKTIFDFQQDFGYNLAQDEYNNDLRFKKIESILEEVEEVSLNPARSSYYMESLIDNFFEFYELKSHYKYIQDKYNSVSDDELLKQAYLKKDYQDVIKIGRYKLLKSILKNEGIRNPEFFIDRFAKIPFNIKNKYQIFEKYYKENK